MARKQGSLELQKSTHPAGPRDTGQASDAGRAAWVRYALDSAVVAMEMDTPLPYCPGQ